MASAEWEIYAQSSRLKSERRKKRLLKKERDKKLIQRYRKLRRLEKEQRDLGYAELIPPIQIGWKRFFVLRQDVMASKDADFFRELLEKINVTEYSHRKDFKVKKRRRGKKVRVERIQQLKMLTDHDLKKLKLTEKEFSYFKPEWKYSKCYNKLFRVYVFTEAWRYVLQMRPNMKTKVKIIDTLLQQQAGEIDKHFDRNNLYPRIRKLLDGHARYCWSVGEKAKYNYSQKDKQFDEMEIYFSNENNL